MEKTKQAAAMTVQQVAGMRPPERMAGEINQNISDCLHSHIIGSNINGNNNVIHVHIGVDSEELITLLKECFQRIDKLTKAVDSIILQQQLKAVGET